MKTQKWMGLLLIVLLGVIALMQSCSKEDDLPMQISQPGWTVRPDFATIDLRPADVIARSHIDGDNVQPVMVLKSAQGTRGKFALVVGISDYAGTRNDLEYCDDDANDWKTYLGSHGYTVTSLTDLNATAANIEAEVNKLITNSSLADEIVFMYSGHGSKGNIVTTDLQYVPSSWFKNKFTNVTCPAFFTFDACQIGAMATDLNNTGRVIAVASSKTSYSYDGDATQKNGVFTYYQMIWFGLSANNNYAEGDSQYACDQFKAWGTANHTKVVPSFADYYKPGNLVY
jgi:hypothetical protein